MGALQRGQRVLVPADVLSADDGGDGGDPMVVVRAVAIPGSNSGLPVTFGVDPRHVIELDVTLDVDEEAAIEPEPSGRMSLDADEIEALTQTLRTAGYLRPHPGVVAGHVDRMLNDGAKPPEHDAFAQTIFAYLAERELVH